MTDQPANSAVSKKEQEMRGWSLQFLLANIKGCEYTCIGGPLEMNLAFSELVRRAELSEKVPSDRFKLKVQPNCSIEVPIGDIDFLNTYSEYRRMKIMRSVWSVDDERTFQEMKSRYHKNNIDLLTN